MPSTFSKPDTHYGNTFNKDEILLVHPKDVEHMLNCLHNLAKHMKYGLHKAPFKITVGEPNAAGLIPIRIRAYSTKNWEQAGERCAEFLSKNIFAFADVRIKCAGKHSYFTIGDFVIKGKQSDECETTFTNMIGNYLIEMDEKNNYFLMSLNLPVKDATPDTGDKFHNTCERLQKALDELQEETSFEDLICQLDPDVIDIEKRLDLEYQERIEAEKRSAELAKRRAKFAEQAAKEQRKSKEHTMNRFASLPVDEPTATPSHNSKKTTSWANKAGEYLPPAVPRTEQRAKPHTARQTKPNTDNRAKPQAEAQAAPTSPTRYKGKCNFGENCRRFDCSFEHPASRDVSKLVSKEEYERTRAEKQQYRSQQSKTACRNGADCTYHNCKFSHPDDNYPEESIAVEKEDKEPETYAVGEGDFPPLPVSSGSNAWF